MTRATLPDLPTPRTRRRAGLAAYVLSAGVWLSVFPITPGEFELLDAASALAGVVFAGATALVVLGLDYPVLELGWGLLAYSFFVRLLDAIAEGPESLESLLPGAVQLVALAVILLGFVRTTGRLRSSLTERKERLTVLNRVLRHNLRTELGVIIGALEHARDDEGPAEPVERGFESVRTLSELGEKLREVDRILERSGEASEPVELNAVVTSAVERYSEAHPDVAFTVRTPEESPVTAVDGTAAAVEELVENACEHNDADDPSVTVTVGAADGDATVSVRDNGSGIPSHELAVIRERDESVLDHGSGIGLWFVLWTVERAGGEVSFAANGGQTVTLLVPTAGRGGLRALLAPWGR